MFLLEEAILVLCYSFLGLKIDCPDGRKQHLNLANMGLIVIRAIPINPKSCVDSNSITFITIS